MKLLRFVRSYFTQPLWFQISLVVVVTLAIILRLYPGKDRIIWNNNDFARDAYTVREMVSQHHFRLLGPRAEIYSPRYQTYVVYAGPIFYYFLAPWYALSHGDPNLPVLAFIFLHVTAMVPLGLLAYRLFQKRTGVIIALLLFAVSYEQIEYSRWLLNPVIALPWLMWMFFFLWETLHHKKPYLQAGLLGFFLGLCLQSEIALGYWAPFVFLTLLITKQKWKTFVTFFTGLFICLLPFLISEIKYHFRMTQSFIFDFLFLHATERFSWWRVLGRWQEHWGLVAKNVLFGLDMKTSFWLLCVLLIGVIFIIVKDKVERGVGIFLLFLFCAPAVIYVTSFVDKIYVDVGVGFALMLLTTFVLMAAWKRWRVLALLFLVGITIAQLHLLQDSLKKNQPFGGYTFLPSENYFFSQKIEIVQRIYTEVGNHFFTISVLDAPYGIPGMWASVFEQYARRTGSRIPNWYGWYAWDTPGDHVFNLNGEPEPIHVVIRPQTLAVDKVTEAVFYQDQNKKTVLIKTILLDNYQIEIRQRK